MANHALPTTASTYTNRTAEIKARIDDVLLGLDPATTTPTNQLINSISWSSAANKWQKWNGTTWNDLSALYAISISGNAATATTLTTPRAINGVNFNGSAAITIKAATPALLTVSSAGSGVASGTTFDGSAARTVSFNSFGATAYGWSIASAADAAAVRTLIVAPSTTGVGASGTWAINITGTASKLVATNWTIQETAGVLEFLHGGTKKMTLDNSGNLKVAGDISAFQTL